MQGASHHLLKNGIHQVSCLLYKFRDFPHTANPGAFPRFFDRLSLGGMDDAIDTTKLALIGALKKVHLRLCNMGEVFMRWIRPGSSCKTEIAKLAGELRDLKEQVDFLARETYRLSELSKTSEQ